MSLEAEILADFTALLAEHGVEAQWQGVTLRGLASRVRDEQKIALGGFVDAPEISLRVARAAFTNGVPEVGQRLTVAGDEYRVTKLSRHPRSPLLTLTLSTPDE